MVTKQEWLQSMQLVNNMLVEDNEHFEPISIDTLSNLCDFFDCFTLKKRFEFNDKYRSLKEATFDSIYELKQYFYQSNNTNILYQVVKHKDTGTYHIRYCSINTEKENTENE